MEPVRRKAPMLSLERMPAVRSASEPMHRFGQRMTEEEWIDMDEDEPGELVDGVLVEEEVPDVRHEVIVAWLTRMLGNWLDATDGIVGGSEAKFFVGPLRGRKPDAFVYFAGSERPPALGGVRVPPDVVIEIISRRARDVRRDRLDKMDDYARFGVRFYWLLDPDNRMLEVYARNDRGEYVRALGAEGKIERVPGCEGLVLDLDALWKKLDALGGNSKPRRTR